MKLRNSSSASAIECESHNAFRNYLDGWRPLAGKTGIKARESKVEIPNTLYAEKDQPQPSLGEFQAAERIFRQPTAAELYILTFSKLRYARSRAAQELSNEFARLLNRGSSLE